MSAALEPATAIAIRGQSRQGERANVNESSRIRRRRSAAAPGLERAPRLEPVPGLEPVPSRQLPPSPAAAAAVCAAPGAERARSTDRQLRLLGQPQLRDHLSFVAKKVVGGAERDRAAVADAWRAANDHYYTLEQTEAGLADGMVITPLDDSLAPLAAEVRRDTRFRNTFDTLPVSFGMVELDRLVLYQRHVNLPFTARLQERIGANPDAEALFRFCLPLGVPDVPVRVQRHGSRRYVFISDSSDFRFHEAVLLQPGQIDGYASFGPIGGIVGLVAGFGTNFLNVISDGNRLLLSNGYHRAYALRSLGITHAPCVIEHVTRKDELALVGHEDVVEDPAFFFRAARPPLLKDFFDSRIATVFETYKIVRIVDFSFEVRDYEVVE